MTDDSTTDDDLIGAQTENRDARTHLYRAALALFTLLAIVAMFQFYLSMGRVIGTFVSYEYRAVFQAAFNFVVLLAAGIGISWTVRKLAA